MQNGIQIKLSTQADSSYEDIFDVYGVRLLRGGYEALLAPTVLKSYVSNESRLSNGTTYVVQDSKVKERKVSLEVSLEADSYDNYLTNFEAFLAKLASGIVYFKVPRLKRVYKLVYTGCSKFSFLSRERSTFTLDLIEPNPSDRIAITT